MNYPANANYMDPLRAVKPYLYADETVLWTGKPYASVPYRAPVSLKIFSLFWLGFSLFWTISAAALGGFVFGLFGIPFVGIGVFLLYSATVGQKKAFAYTAYAVTDRRALIVTTGRKGVDFCEYALSDLDNIALENMMGEVGTLRLVPQQFYYDRNGNRRTNTPDIKTAFMMIDDVRKVYHIILEHRE